MDIGENSSPGTRSHTLRTQSGEGKDREALRSVTHSDARRAALVYLPPRLCSSSDPPATTVTPALRGGEPALPGYSGFEFRLLLEDPEVGAPELVVVHRAELRPGDEGRRASVRLAGDVGDHEL